MRAVLAVAVVGLATAGCWLDGAAAPEQVEVPLVVLSKEVQPVALNYRGGTADLITKATISVGEPFVYDLSTLGDECRRPGRGGSGFRRDGDTLRLTITPMDTVYTVEGGPAACGSLRKFKRETGGTNNFSATPGFIKLTLVGVNADNGEAMEIVRVIEVR